jgi:Short C-terminal domain
MLPTGSGRTTRLDWGMSDDFLMVSKHELNGSPVGADALSDQLARGTLRAMSGSRTAPRIVLVVAIVTLVVSIVGFIVTLLLNIFVWDKYDAYGEVPIPGSASLQLPAGEVTISFHTQVIGIDAGLPVPNMGVSIDPPDGVPDPVLVEDIGSTTTVNQDARVRVWVAQIPADGTYAITTEGNVSAFVSPRLSFGHSSSLGWLPVVFGVLFAVGILDVLAASFWLARVKARSVAPVWSQDTGTGTGDAFDFDSDAVTDAPADFQRPTVADTRTSFEPTEDGIRIQQLKTLAALRDSGALTEDEFKSEKKRLLDGR